MNDEVDLLDRARASTWPSTMTDGATARRHGDRRRRQRTGLVAAIAVGGIAVGGGVTALLSQPSPTGTDAASNVETITMRDVSFTVPPGWSIIGSPVKNHLCISPADSGTDCAVVFAVAADPGAAPMAGLDVVPDLMSVCERSDARIVEVEGRNPTAPASTLYSGRCNRGDTAMSAWALDNRIAYVITRSPRWNSVAGTVFGSIELPAQWQDPAESSTESPTP